VAAKAAPTTARTIFELGLTPPGWALSPTSTPGGNLTGLANLNVEVGPKRLELLHELLPVTVIAALLSPANPALAEPFLRSLRGAAPKLGLENPRSEMRASRAIWTRCLQN